MHFATIIASLQRAEPTPHTPDFRLAKENDAWRVYDGARALALCRASSLDIWAFSPFEPDELANPEPPGEVVDIHTVHNTYINFGYQTWPEHWNGHPLTWNWLRVAGTELEAEISLSAPHGEYCHWRLTICYDAARARYRYQVTIAARKHDPDGFEAFNLMAPGALADCPERRRWTHTLWENQNNTLRRLVHSSALLLGTDYASTNHKNANVPGMQSGPWRHRNLPYPCAWVAYAGHPSFNPALMVHQTSVPLRGATCDQLFDEHLFWNTAGQDNLADDGFFHYRMTLEIVNLPTPLMHEMLTKATDPVRPARWHHERVALPFYLNRPNLFDTPIDPWEPEECAIILLPSAATGAAMAWDTAGRNGSRSLRLQTNKTGEVVSIVPEGAVCRTRPHTRCRLSGWLRTDGPSPQARLLLQAYAYSYSNILHATTSKPVTTALDWTRVEIELDCGAAAYVMPRLELTGPGTAWFTEVQLETSITRTDDGSPSPAQM